MNTVHTGVFTYQPNNYEWSTSSANSKSRCKDDQQNLIDKDSWPIIVEKISLDYDDKVDKLLLDGHTLPCLHSDGFCKPTLKHPFIFVWFPEEICLLFHISDYIGQLSELDNRYWLETDDFFDSTGKNTRKFTRGILPTVVSHKKSQLGTNTPTLSRLEIFPQKNNICRKPTQMQPTQYPDFFVT